MRKATLTLLTIATLSSTPAIAGWDPIGDLKKGIEHVAEQVRDGVAKGAENVRDGFGAIGNATGLTDVIDKNAKTISDIGRVNSCFATLCYSERMRAQIVAEAEEKARQDFEASKEKLREHYRAENKKAMLDTVALQIESARTRVQTLEETLKIQNAALSSLNSVQAALISEIEFRNQLISLKIDHRPLENLETVPVAKEFANTPISQESLDRVNSAIDALNTSTKRAKAKLIAEFMRALEAAPLKEFCDYVLKQSRDISLSTAGLRIDLAIAKAELDACIKYQKDLQK